MMFLRKLPVFFVVIGIAAVPIYSQDTDSFGDYPEPVADYLKHIFSEDQLKCTFRADYPGGFQQWQRDLRPLVCDLIGLNKIAIQTGDHQPVVELQEIQDLGDYTRQKGTIETEPNVVIPFWLLKPKRKGLFHSVFSRMGTTREGTILMWRFTMMRPIKKKLWRETAMLRFKRLSGDFLPSLRRHVGWPMAGCPIQKDGMAKEGAALN